MALADHLADFDTEWAEGDDVWEDAIKRDREREARGLPPLMGTDEAGE